MPPSFGSSGGSSTEQTPCAFGQRVWKRHAEGGAVGDGHVTAEHLASCGAGQRGSATGTALQQRARVGMARVVVQLVGGRQLDDLPEVHHRDAVAHVTHDAEVMGDEDDRQPEVALKVAQQVDDLRLDRDVQRGDGLVGDDQLGFSAIARATPMRWRWPPENSCG